MDHVIGAGVRGVSRSIAVVSEVVAGRRASNSAPDTNDPEHSDSDDDILSREQDLDDVADDLVDESEKQDDQQTGAGVAQGVANAFINNHQKVMTVPTSLQPLPQPVILPQRRPKHRSRGFIRAYAPSLGECSGIDQAMFMDFLISFDRAAKAWPIFNVINIAAFGIGMVPHAPFIAASTAMNIAASVGEELQTRYTINKFLDDINETMFKPRKLYALMMTYRPDLPDDALLRADITDPQSVALSKALDRDAGNSLKQKMARFRVSSGVTQHEDLMPEPAPLIYPALDQALLTQGQDTSMTTISTQLTSSSSSIERTKSKSNASIVQDYLDRRAQAEFLAAHPDSKLAATLPPQQKKFVNRFADPDHPVNSGSVFGLLSGGTWDPIASGRVRRAEKKAKKKGEQPLTQDERHDAYMGRKVRGRTTGTPSKDKILGISKMFSGSVLYLVITNLPESGEEVQMTEK